MFTQLFMSTEPLVRNAAGRVIRLLHTPWRHIVDGVLRRALDRVERAGESFLPQDQLLFEFQPTRGAVTILVLSRDSPLFLNITHAERELISKAKAVDSPAETRHSSRSVSTVANHRKNFHFWNKTLTKRSISTGCLILESGG